MYHNPKIQTWSVTIMRVRRATHQGTPCHIIRSAWPKMKPLEVENRRTKRQRLSWPWEKPLMTQEQLDRFAQGYSYERYVRGLTGQRVVLSPRPWLTQRAGGARLAPQPPVEPPPAHVLRMQHQDKGGNDRWNNLPPHLDSLQGDTQEKSCSML